MIEIRDGFQDMTARVQHLGPIDKTGRVLAREQDDLGVDERSRDDTLTKGLAERRCGCHTALDRGRRYRPSFYILKAGEWQAEARLPEEG